MNLESSPSPRYRLTALFLIAVVFAWLAPDFWLRSEIRLGSVGATYENSDLYQFVYPAYEYGFGQLRAGRVPLWNPTQRCGIAHQPDPRMGLFQPLNLVFLLFPTAEAMALQAFVCLFLMGAFFALFARALGVRYVPALIGGIAYAFSGAAAGAMSRPELASALAWSPFVFWAATEYTQRFRKSTAVVAGLGLGLLILSGSYAAGVAMLLVLAPFVLFGILRPREAARISLPQRIAGLGIMIGVAVLVSAIQWLPTLAWFRGLEHPADILWHLKIAGQTPANPREFVAHLLSAAPGTLPRACYVGIPVLLLVPIALLHRAGLREAVFFFLAAGALLTLLLLDGYALPFGYPRAALLFPFTFCLATLATLGADRLFTPRRNLKRPSAWPPFAAIVLATALVATMTDSQGRGYVLAFLAIALTFLVVRARWLAPLGGLILAALLFTDLSAANVNTFRHPYQDAPECYQQHGSAVELARQQSLGGRVVVASRDLDTLLPANLGMLTGIPVVGGAHLPLTRAEALWWQHLTGREEHPVSTNLIPLGDTATPALLDFMAARAVLVAADAPLIDGTWQSNGPRLRLIQETGNARVYVNEDAYPRAYWTPTCRYVEDIEQAIAELVEHEIRTAKACVVQVPSRGLANVPIAASPASASASEEPTCSLEGVSAERVVVRIQAPTAGVTILADTFAPGWEARLDNAPCEILRANGLFRGVLTPAGGHEIVFEYRPPGYGIGRIISLVSLAVIALLGLFVIAKRLLA